ncbi:ribonuclease P protein subunit [Candidatus Woesearchaeota archaeon]|nr:ribonuclease P protein subunit [Candidatus Woesearchaeota archaeon]
MRPKIHEEIIGKKLRVVEADNKSLVGTEGTIINETKNTITISDKNKKKKMILKKQAKFEINGKILEGESMARRSEERIKRG